MNNMFQYKGYLGSREYSEEDEIFFGKSEFIRSLVSYEAEREADLESAFREAIDDYLSLCKMEGLTPDTPFQGVLRVNVGEGLHRQLAFLAAERGVDLNRLVAEVLVNYVGNV